MSQFWSFEGIGLKVSELYPYLDAKKVVNFLHKELPDDEEIDEIVKTGRYDRMNLDPNVCVDGKLDIEDYVRGVYNGLADMFTMCDDTDVLTYSSDDEGGEYMFYPPSMPWQMTDTEPKSLTEVHIRIINAVQKLTNMTVAEIEELIDDDLQVVCYQ